MQFIEFIIFLLMNFSLDTEGIVTISPSRIASVCSENQLELMCTTTETFLRWEFTVITESGGTAMTFTRTVSSLGSSSNIEPLTVNSTTFTFARTSAQDGLPLTSRLFINPASVGLNGTALNCVEVATSKRSTTTIHILKESVTLPDVTIKLHSEQFESDDVSIMLEWNESNSQISYSVTSLPQLSIDFVGSTSLQLMVPYNTFYNVSVTPYLCRQIGTTSSIQLNYTKCGNISVNSNDLLTVAGYRDPAIEGTNISFSCSPGSIMLAGPNESTCTEEGQWEPDPREVICQARCETPQCIVQIADSTTVIGYRDSTVQQTLSSSCCSGILVTGRNGTTCVEDGQWELNATQMEIKSDGDTTSDYEVLTITLVSTICGFVIFSAIMFGIGFVCGHRFGQTDCCKRTSAIQSGDVTPEVPPRLIPVRRQEQDLKLKENVSYEPLHVT